MKRRLKVTSLVAAAVFFVPTVGFADVPLVGGFTQLYVSDAEVLTPVEPAPPAEPVAASKKSAACCHCDDYCMVYRTRLFRRMCRCATQEVKLEVKDPLRCGCVACVPVCIPACCKGEPKVHASCGLLGRGYVTFCWDCGYTVQLTFLKLQPKIIVSAR